MNYNYNNNNNNNRVVYKYKAILFSDIVGSSKLWKRYSTVMNDKLIEHEKRMSYFISLYNGLIIKTIGDAFMVSFDKLEDAVYCAIQIQLDLLEYPIRFDNKKNNYNNILKLRIGIAYGIVNERKVLYQDTCMLKDYYGNTVNLSSRMESKVAKKAFNIAFCCYNCDIPPMLLDNLTQFNYPLKKESYREKCDNYKRRRSSRLIKKGFIPQICYDVNILNGVPPIDAIVIDLSTILHH